MSDSGGHFVLVSDIGARTFRRWRTPAWILLGEEKAGNVALSSPWGDGRHGHGVWCWVLVLTLDVLNMFFFLATFHG